MKKVIVTTTINSPTKAITAFDEMKDYELVVIGDKKTPSGYKIKNGLYVSPEDQEKKFKNLSELLGWNCIQRRNIGFLFALEMGADIIATIDDDNIPMSEWGKNLTVGKKIDVKSYDSNEIVFDPIGATNYPSYWHRGFPIQLVPNRLYDDDSKTITIIPKVQADFWNGDPDVDAICRMIYKPSCVFEDEFFPFSTKLFTPFNSQNTFLHKSVMPYYFMFPGIGRLDDIWGAYFMEALTNERPIFCRASVFQDRNVHDLTKDFTNEIIGYEKTLSLLGDLKNDPYSIYKYLPGRTVASYIEYNRIAERYL